MFISLRTSLQAPLRTPSRTLELWQRPRAAAHGAPERRLGVPRPSVFVKRFVEGVRKGVRKYIRKVVRMFILI